MPVILSPAVAPKETGGSPEFPDYPFEHMPRSQTPVVSCTLALARTGLLPSGHWTQSALGSVARTYPLSTTIHFSGLNDAACALTSPLLRTPPLSDRALVRLSTRWLTFGRVGLIGFHRRTHWVTLTSFKGCHPCSLVPDLSRHEHPIVRPFHFECPNVRDIALRIILSFPPNFDPLVCTPPTNTPPLKFSGIDTLFRVMPSTATIGPFSSPLMM